MVPHPLRCPGCEVRIAIFREITGQHEQRIEIVITVLEIGFREDIFGIANVSSSFVVSLRAQTLLLLMRNAQRNANPQHRWRQPIETHRFQPRSRFAYHPRWGVRNGTTSQCNTVQCNENGGDVPKPLSDRPELIFPYKSFAYTFAAGALLPTGRPALCLLPVSGQSFSGLHLQRDVYCSNIWRPVHVPGGSIGNGKRGVKLQFIFPVATFLVRFPDSSSRASRASSPPDGSRSILYCVPALYIFLCIFASNAFACTPAHSERHAGSRLSKYKYANKLAVYLAYWCWFRPHDDALDDDRQHNAAAHKCKTMRCVLMIQRERERESVRVF